MSHEPMSHEPYWWSRLAVVVLTCAVFVAVIVLLILVL